MTTKLPAKEFIPLLRSIAAYAELYRNTKGHRTGFDSHMNKKFAGIHEFLLNAKRRGLLP